MRMVGSTACVEQAFGSPHLLEMMDLFETVDQISFGNLDRMSSAECFDLVSLEHVVS